MADIEDDDLCGVLVTPDAIDFSFLTKAPGIVNGAGHAALLTPQNLELAIEVVTKEVIVQTAPPVAPPPARSIATKPAPKTFSLIPDGYKPTLREARPLTERKASAKVNGTAPPGVAAKKAASVSTSRKDTEFGKAITQEISRLRRYARSLTRNLVAADDLVQATLTRAVGKQSLYQDGTDLRAWLFTIMHNQHVNEVRRSVREGVKVAVDDGSSAMIFRGNQIDKVMLSDLEKNLRKLPEEQRQVILMVSLEDMRYEEVAEVLAVPVGTVRSRLSRGRETLRKLMDNDTGQPPLVNGSGRLPVHSRLPGRTP